tara:strand:+ start:8232 stop:8477 length:246 start_codon:yes stop_codon:yes gene_type:complete
MSATTARDETAPSIKTNRVMAVVAGTNDTPFIGAAFMDEPPIPSDTEKACEAAAPRGVRGYCSYSAYSVKWYARTNIHISH